MSLPEIRVAMVLKVATVAVYRSDFTFEKLLNLHEVTRKVATIAETLSDV